MSNSPYVVEATQENFMQLVEKSQEVPILVDFWADWCQPCQALGPILEKLAEEYRGGFILAKVDTEKEQALAQHFQIRSLPTVQLIHKGQMVKDFVGVQPESAYREALNALIELPGEDLLGQADAALEQGDAASAQGLYQQALAADPESQPIKLKLAQALITSADFPNARIVLESLPEAAQKEDPAKGMLTQIAFAESANSDANPDELQARIEANSKDSEARTELAKYYVSTGNYEAALDTYLELMKVDAEYDDQAGRKGMLAVFELLGSNPLVSTYRRKMFTLLH